MNITLTPTQMAELIDSARAELVAQLITRFAADLQLLTVVQVCGLLNMNQKALESIKADLPRVTIVPGSVIRYRACDVAEFIQRRRD